MVEWICRVLFVLAGFITSWFVAGDALNFQFVQMVIAVLLVTVFVALIAFWPEFKRLFSRFRKK